MWQAAVMCWTLARALELTTQGTVTTATPPTVNRLQLYTVTKGGGSGRATAPVIVPQMKFLVSVMDIYNEN